jgi:hypothetical protein
MNNTQDGVVRMVTMLAVVTPKLSRYDTITITIKEPDSFPRSSATIVTIVTIVTTFNGAISMSLAKIRTWSKGKRECVPRGAGQTPDVVIGPLV